LPAGHEPEWTEAAVSISEIDAVSQTSSRLPRRSPRTKKLPRLHHLLTWRRGNRQVHADASRSVAMRGDPVESKNPSSPNRGLRRHSFDRGIISPYFVNKTPTRCALKLEMLRPDQRKEAISVNECFRCWKLACRRKALGDYRGTSEGERLPTRRRQPSARWPQGRTVKAVAPGFAIAEGDAEGHRG